MARRANSERESEVTTQVTTRKFGTEKKALLVGLALGTVLAASVALVGGTAREADAAFADKIIFASNRTVGKGVDNPTGDREIFRMNSNGTGAKQLTFNAEHDVEPALSPDGTKIAYMSRGDQTSNPEGDWEIYIMNALDGSNNRNLTDNGAGVDDLVPDFSPDGTRIAYQSRGAQASNAEGDSEVYVMNAQDGTGKKNLSNNYLTIDDYDADFSPDGTKVAYASHGSQTSNPEGDGEVYVMDAADGSGQKNLSNDSSFADDVYPHFSPNGQRIVYTSRGVQASNPEGDSEVYLMNAQDGSGRTNLSNTGFDVSEDVPLFSPDGTKVAYQSSGAQTSNPEGDPEVYAMSAIDGSGKRNLTNNGINEVGPVFSPDGTKIAYLSRGVQGSNPEGDYEIYRMNTSDGSSKKNLTNNAAEYDESPEWRR
jgi:Tol biopolymer transport system component